MSKKILSVLIVLVMVLSLISGFTVMAEDTAGEMTESMSESESDTEEISENDAGLVIMADEDLTGEPEEEPTETVAVLDIEAGEQEVTEEPQTKQPVAETEDDNTLYIDAGLKTAEEETADMHVWTLGHGKVLVNGSDYGTEFQGTWINGAEVTVEAVPSSGYKLNRWWVKTASGSGKWIGTEKATLIAGSDLEADAMFGLITAYVTITPPAAGTTAATAPQVSFPDGAGYGLDTITEFLGPVVTWVKGDALYRMEELDPDTTFEVGKTYYAYIRLRDGADSFAAMAGGSTFNTDLQVTGGTKSAQGNFAATNYDESIYMGIEAIIAVTIPEATHTVNFDMRGHYTEVASQKVKDGEKAVKPASPSNYDKASDYDTTGLRFRMWHEELPGNLTYDTLWNNAYNFQEPITEDKTLYAIYESILTLRTYDITNSTERAGGTITWSDVYWRTPQTESSIQTTMIEGTQETLTANPAEGYTFVGWSSSKSKDDIVSTDTTYKFINDQRRTVYALFEEEAPLDVTVTFHANGGTPEPVVQTVESGSKAVEPAALTKEGGWNFGGWYKDEECEEAFSFESAVTANLDLYARWNGQLSVSAYDKTGDKTNAGGTFDYETIEGVGEKVNSYNSEKIAEGTPVALTAYPAEGYRFVGWAQDTKDGKIVSTDAKYEFLFKETPVTLFAVFEKTLTIRWSSIDGVDLMDPIEIPITAGSQLGDILENAGYNFYESPFEKEGYIPFGCFYDRPVTDFSSYNEMYDLYDGKLSPSTVVNDSMDIYAIMLKSINVVELTIEQPVCGTSTEVPERHNAWTDQINPPVVSVPDGRNYSLSKDQLPAIWILESGYDYEGEFAGGEEYNAAVILKAVIGYGFASGTNGNFNGQFIVSSGELVETVIDDDILEAFVKVSAVHDPADPVNENVVEPGCTDAGSHDEVIYCTACEKEISRKAVVDPALGHDWGEWEVTKEPSSKEDGEETRTCARCSETETRTIPYSEEEEQKTEGGGSSGEKGSAAPAPENKAPKTGDDSNIGVWALLLAASVISILFILIQMRRNKKSRV